MAVSPNSRFPGFGDTAPLDISAFSAATTEALVQRVADGSFDAWAETAARVGYCARPVRLVGSSTTVDPSTGQVLNTFSSDQSPLGVVYRPCGNRRADVCPSCSRVYARDTFEMLRAGLVGGKTVSTGVARNPVLFATFTAPSFGSVHGPRPVAGSAAGGRCRPRDKSEKCRHGRPTGCMSIHEPDDDEVGAPLCDECYDWEGAVVWNWWAPELWRRTVMALRRGIAAELGAAGGIPWRVGVTSVRESGRVPDARTGPLSRPVPPRRTVDRARRHPWTKPELGEDVPPRGQRCRILRASCGGEYSNRLIQWGIQIDVRLFVEPNVLTINRIRYIPSRWPAISRSMPPKTSLH